MKYYRNPIASGTLVKACFSSFADLQDYSEPFYSAECIAGDWAINEEHFVRVRNNDIGLVISEMPFSILLKSPQKRRFRSAVLFGTRFVAMPNVYLEVVNVKI